MANSRQLSCRFHTFLKVQWVREHRGGRGGRPEQFGLQPAKNGTNGGDEFLALPGLNSPENPKFWAFREMTSPGCLFLHADGPFPWANAGIALAAIIAATAKTAKIGFMRNLLFFSG
jgi:hypothetical protein